MTRLAVPLALLLAGAARADADGGVTVIVAPPEIPVPVPGTVVLGAPGTVAALCRVVGPERTAPRGDAVERERARETAFANRYQVTVPGRRLSFAAYDAGDGVLRLSARTVLFALDGALRLWAVDDPQLPARAPPEAVRRILDAQRDGTLSLSLTFELDQEDDGADPCVHVPGSGQYTLALSPVSWEWRARGRALARGGDDAYRPVLSAAEGARPAVEVGSAVGDGDVASLREPLAALSGELRACYAEALARRPRLDGVLVLELGLDPRGGPPRGARVSADSLHDGGLAACALRVAARARFPAAGAPSVSLPVRFSLEAPGTAR